MTGKGDIQNVAVIDAKLICPTCQQPSIQLGVKFSTTVWVRCTNPDCEMYNELQDPEILA